MGYEVHKREENGEVKSYIVTFDDGTPPDTFKANAKNTLLFDPEYDMYSFVEEGGVKKLSEDPEVIIGSSENTYFLSVEGYTIETMPSQSADFLEGVLEWRKGNGVQKLTSLHSEIISDQIRRQYINPLTQMFDPHRIEVTSNGWLIDGFILINWDASVYLSEDDTESYERRGGQAVKVDKSKQFVEIRVPQLDPKSVTLNGTEIQLTEREMVFLTRVEWLLHRRDYHPDRPFWDYAERFMPDADEIEEPKGF